MTERHGEIGARLTAVKQRIAAALEQVGRPADSCRLLAVSKRKPVADILAALHGGQLEFGENRVQDLVEKAEDLVDTFTPPKARWHMIGSLQTNKVKHLLRVPNLGLLHSLDRVELADALNARLARVESKLEVLVQVEATGDANKHGVIPEQAPALIEHVQEHCPQLEIQGLMAMGPLEGEPSSVFRSVATLRELLRERSGLPMPELSLGMSGDLEAGVAAGSTLVRIGSDIFGSRS